MTRGREIDGKFVELSVIHKRKHEIWTTLTRDHMSRRDSRPAYEPRTVDEAALVEIILHKEKQNYDLYKQKGKLSNEISAMHNRVHQANMRARKKILDKGLIRQQKQIRELKTEIRRLKGEIPPWAGAEPPNLEDIKMDISEAEAQAFMEGLPD